MAIFSTQKLKSRWLVVVMEVMISTILLTLIYYSSQSSKSEVSNRVSVDKHENIENEVLSTCNCSKSEREEKEEFNAGDDHPTPTPKSGPSIFYFAVTYEGKHDLARLADETWGSRTEQPVVWYTSTLDGAPPHAHVVPPANAPGNPWGYETITLRMLAIWDHVVKNYPGYDWYVRAWDDNFIFVDRMKEHVSHLDPNVPQRIGRPGVFFGQPYLGGGASEAVSKAAIEKMKEVGGEGWLNCIPHFHAMFKTCQANYCGFEDGYLAGCFEAAGVSQIGSPRFHSESISSPASSAIAMSYQDAICGKPAAEFRGDWNFFLNDVCKVVLGGGRPWTGPSNSSAGCMDIPTDPDMSVVTLHYVSAVDMRKLNEQVLIGCPLPLWCCDKK